MSETSEIFFGVAFIIIGILLFVFRRKLALLNFSYRPGQGIRQQTDEAHARQSGLTTIAGAVLCVCIGVAVLLVAAGKR